MDRGTNGRAMLSARSSSRMPASVLSSALQEAEDLVLLRKPSELLLREDLLSVRRDLEHSALALDQLALHAERFLDVSRQTGGSRPVVSLHPDLYPHTHLVCSPA